MPTAELLVENAPGENSGLTRGNWSVHSGGGLGMRGMRRSKQRGLRRPISPTRAAVYGALTGAMLTAAALAMGLLGSRSTVVSLIVGGPGALLGTLFGWVFLRDPRWIGSHRALCVLLSVVFNCLALGLAFRSVSRVIRSTSPRDAYSRCRRCGYRLTGNVSGVCPECGKAILNTAMKREE